jgi:integrase
VWAKKIRGKMHYFGPWEDPQCALARYNEQKDDLHAGRSPRPDPAAATVKEAANSFLARKEARVDAGELSPRTWADYREACEEVVRAFGKGRLVADLGPADFASLRNRMAKKWGPHRLKKTILCVRSVFKHALENGLIGRPVRFGPDFTPPARSTLRIHRARQGAKLFTAEEVRALAQGALVVGSDGPELVQAGAQLRAMVMLGINCGLGNADCGRLTGEALDLKRGWLDYARLKTGMPRRCPLWPETVAAIQEALACRREPKDPADAGVVFVTRTGQAWHTDTSESPISYEVGKLLRRLGIGGRKGLGFYTLRHTFRTVADEAKDQPAADYIMGHEVAHMSSVYREGISDDRLRAVADHVRGWLFGDPPAGDTANSASRRPAP